jgi:hypothetical protein
MSLKYAFKGLLFLVMVLASAWIAQARTRFELDTVRIADATTASFASPSHDWIVVVRKKTIACYSLRNGDELWSKKSFGDAEQIASLVQWVNDNEVLIPDENDLLFVNGRTGAELGRVGLPFGSVNDVVIDGLSATDFVRIYPQRHGNILLVPQEEGYQVVDLVKRKEVFRAASSLDDLQVNMFEDYLLLYHTGDTSVVLDARNPRVISAFAVSDDPLASNFTQRLVVFNGQALILHENSLRTIDVASGKSKVVFTAVDDALALCLLIREQKPKLFIQTEETLTCYDVKGLFREWSIRPSQDSFGIMSSAYHGEKGSMHIVAHTSSNELRLHTLDFETGLLEHSSILALSGRDFKRINALSRSGEYSSYSYSTTMPSGPPMSGGFTTSVTYGGSTLYSQTQLRGAHHVDDDGFHTRASQMCYKSDLPIGDSLFSHIVNEEMFLISPSKAPFARVVSCRNDSVFVFVAGPSVPIESKTMDPDDFVGEGLHVINRVSGKRLAYHVLVSLPRDYVVTHDSLNRQQPYLFERGTLLCGSNNMMFIAKSGHISKTNFRTDKMTVLYADKNSVTVRLDVTNEIAEVWRVEMGDSLLTPKLIFYTREGVGFRTTRDTIRATETIVASDTSVAFYELMASTPLNEKPLFRISREDLYGLMLDPLDDPSAGIAVLEKGYIVAGEEGVAYCDPRTSCLAYLGKITSGKSDSTSWRVGKYIETTDGIISVLRDDRILAAAVADQCTGLPAISRRYFEDNRFFASKKRSGFVLYQDDTEEIMCIRNKSGNAPKP